MINIKNTKNVFFELKNSHFIAKFHDSLNFNFDKSRNMLFKLRKTRFGNGKTFHGNMIDQK